MKKQYTAPKQQAYIVYSEEHILAASDNITTDDTTTGEAGNSYSIDKSELWDTEWDDE